MFTRPQPILPETISQVSQAAPLGVRRGKRIRLGKRAFALAVCLIGAGALLSDAGYVTSDNAVVTSHLVSLRSPIEGVVRSRAGVVGAAVQPGMFLAEVENPLADDRQVAAMRSRLDRGTADLQSTRDQRTALEAVQRDLLSRSANHRSAKVTQLYLESNRIGRGRSAKAAELDQLVRDMRRKLALTGVVSHSVIEQAQTAVRVAAQQVQSLDQQIAQTDAETRSVQGGVIVDANSGSDVAYSDQRADEVRMRLIDLDRMIAGLAAEVAETGVRLDAETEMAQRQRIARLNVPSGGMIWRLGAAPGERVAVGDLLAQVVDCSAAVLAVAIPQERVPDLDLSQVVSFRLAGEQAYRTGRILAVTGEAAVRGDAALAAEPAASNRPVAAMLVGVPPSPDTAGACLVGRTARVVLPAAGGWLDWVRRRLPSFSSHAG